MRFHFRTRSSVVCDDVRLCDPGCEESEGDDQAGAIFADRAMDGDRPGGISDSRDGGSERFSAFIYQQVVDRFDAAGRRNVLGLVKRNVQDGDLVRTRTALAVLSQIDDETNAESVESRSTVDGERIESG